MAHVAKVTFTRGEITPLLHARGDIELYKAAAKTLQNWYVLKEGGIRRRSGTKFAGKIKFDNKDTRLVDFIFNSSQAYAIEMGDVYTRFWTAGAPIVASTKTITGATQANPCVITATAHGFSNGDYVNITGIVGMTRLNNRQFVIGNVAANTFELTGINSTTYGAYVSGGIADKVYDIVSPYAEADLRSIQWAQSFDTMFFVRPSTSVVPKKLQRSGNASWAWADVAFIDGPYLSINDKVTKVHSSATKPQTGNTDTLTFSAVTGINGGSGFLATDVGRLIRVEWSGVWFWGVIATRSSTTVITVTWKLGCTDIDGSAGFNNGDGAPSTAITTNVDATKDVASWRLGAFSQTTGYPASIAWFQGRLCMGNTANNPSAFWYSNSGQPETFSPSAPDGTVTDSHSAMVSVVGRADGILWLKEATRLQIGTTGAIRSVGGTSSGDALGPRNISQALEVVGGVEPIVPIGIGPSTIHVSKYAKQIHDLYFDWNVNSLVAPDLSVTAEHMFDAGMKELWFQQYPNSLFWGILNDGTLVATTIERYEKVVGFSRQPLAGGNVISGCVIPGSAQDDLYMVVRRTVNGSQVQYMETLQPRFLRNNLVDAWFVDSGGQYVGSLTNTVSGINWLEGAAVDVLGDGFVYRALTITNGVLTLPAGKTAAKITFGVGIVNIGGILSPPVDAPDGSSKGRKMRVIDVIADVYETQGLKFTSNTGQVDSFVFRDPNLPMNVPDALITGTRKLKIDGSWQSTGLFTWSIDDPLPGTIRALNVGLDYEP